MRTIPVRTSSEYVVKVGTGLLPALGAEVSSVVKGKRVAIVSDNNVWPLYGKKIEQNLLQAGFSTCHFIIPAGESSKNGQMYLQLVSFLAEEHLGRDDCIIAFGGGVTGDLAGFAAATYLRGISYIQLPTTLLAMVDSSVGGKTAIDLPGGKNLLGAFYQPKLVLCDISFLNTLPKSVFIDGCAEVIKYGILYDISLFEHLEAHGLQFNREEVISNCIALKANVVMQDEYDINTRQMLNLGHTIGHAIEKSSNYTISHGQAVSTGISIFTRAATTMGLCNEADCQRIIALFQQFQLSTTTDFAPCTLAQQALSDKKRVQDKISLIFPATIGCCKQISYSIRDLESLIKAGM